MFSHLRSFLLLLATLVLMPPIRGEAAVDRPPTLTITTPVAEGKVPEGVLSVTGRVTDDNAVLTVEVSLNDGPFVPASYAGVEVKTPTNYSLQVSPRVGRNKLTVRASDSRGNQTFALRNFNYLVKRPLALAIQPLDGGTVQVSPNVALGDFILGSSYQLSAVPRKGYVWNGWIGEGLAGAVAESPVLSVQMTEGLALRADFIPNPFVASIQGDYEGLVTAAAFTPEGHSSNGVLSLKLTGNGAFSGALILGSERYPVSGTVDNSGHARFGASRLRELRLDRLNRPSLAVSLVLEFSEDPTFRATVGEYSRTGVVAKSEAVLARIYFDGSTPAKSMSAATYNFALPSKAQTNGLDRGEFPRGAGFGTVTVDAKGQGSVEGTLADGSAMSAKIRFNRERVAVLYSGLYGGNGQIVGRVQVDEGQRDTDLYGPNLRWFKPQLNEHYYPKGWPEGLTLELLGTRFRKPVAGSVLPELAVGGESNAVLSFLYGGLSSAVRKAVFLSEKDVVRRVPGADVSFNLALNHETGKVSGDFTATENGRAGFSGVVLSKGANRQALGFFLSPKGTVSDGTGKSGLVQLGTRITGKPSLIISEFMARNKSTIADEDGDFSDWLELYNPKGTALDLSGWHLTDDAQEPAKWEFPAVTLGAREFLLIWASGKNRRVPGAPLHTNFALSASGEYLAVVRPDGLTVEQEMDGDAPGLSADESYGIDFSGVQLVSGSASARVKVSQTTPGVGWNQPAFNESSWRTAKLTVGFGVGVSGFVVRQVEPSGVFGGVGNLAQAKALLAYSEGAPQIASERTVTLPELNFVGDGDDGHYADNWPLPILNLGSYVLSGRARVLVPAEDFYTFGLNSDDGGTILIDGVPVMVDDSNHGPEDHLGAPVRLTAGVHSIEVVMWEGGSGDCLELFAARGAHTSWNREFYLVGSPKGLATAGGAETDLESVMRQVSASAYVRVPFSASAVEKLETLTLRVAYNDGFVAYLNGIEIARRNAPVGLAESPVATAERDAEQTKAVESIDVSAFVGQLRTGGNVLAFIGLNRSSGDASFYLAPTLTAYQGFNGKSVLYSPGPGGSPPTPGAINAPDPLGGKIGPSTFSVKHGVYSVPFDLVIQNPRAGVKTRYTLDGSTPSATHGTLYTGPLRISKTTVLRSFAYHEVFVAGAPQTQTYLFLDDVIRQSANGAAPGPGWPTQPVNDQVFDYGMDPKIVNNSNPLIGGATKVKDALAALPSISVVTDLGNLFEPTTGIWVNAGARGRVTEKEASVEVIGDTVDPSGGFQINCGLRLRGGYSRTSGNPKHSLKLYFRDSYAGGGVLKYPMVGGDGATLFEEINLRTAQNYSWSLEGGEANSFLREETARELQGAMGHLYSRARNFHLYLNGQYWGIYNTDERPEASFAVAYMGGNKEDYDVVKAEQDDDYSTGVTDGNLDAWAQLFEKTKAHALDPSNARYFGLQGKASDGVTLTTEPVLLDVDNFIDYLLLTFWTGNIDGCTSAFLGETHANNWSGIRDRTGKTGFRFFVHDFEHTMFDLNQDRTGPFVDDQGKNPWEGPDATFAQLRYSNPMFMHYDLLQNPEYRMRWADRAQKHLFGGGALTPAKVLAKVRRRAEIVGSAIIAESARWGDAKVSEPRTREDWLRQRDYLLNEYIPDRGSRVLTQLREDGLYPATQAPVVNRTEKTVERGAELVLEAGGVPVLYTLDGSDPRLVGGSINSAAQAYVGSSSTEVLVAAQSEWKYLADGSDQGTGWKEVSFDASAWSSGIGELGYGDGDERTVVSFVDVSPESPEIQKNATTYFRRSFSLASKTEASAAKMRVKYDDAVIVYLNGVEVARSANIESGAQFNSYANGSAPNEGGYFEFEVPLSAVQEGVNVLAAEVHQASPDSSDISFDLSFELTKISTQTPLILGVLGNVTLKARALQNGVWSALLKQEFEVRDFANLRVTPVALTDFAVGAEGVLELHVSNTGVLGSSGMISVESDLPVGVTAVSLSGTGWLIVRGQGASVRARYEGVVLPGGALPVLSLRVAVGDSVAGLIAPVFRVTGGGDPTGSDNEGRVQVPVTRSDRGRISFEQARIVAFEEDRRVSINVVRGGNRSGAASVRLRTGAGSARLTTDFFGVDQIVEFADGETSKEVGVDLVVDSVVEPNETFTVSLTEVSEGAELGSPATATVLILSADLIPPKVSLERPAAGERVVAYEASIAGLVTDERGVDRVEVRLNKGDFERVPITLSADGLSARFNAGIDARTGQNTLEVRGFDHRGNESVHVSRSFLYVPLRPLTLVAEPVLAGSVKLSAGARVDRLEVGKRYSVSAIPKAGNSFAGWSVTGMTLPSFYENPLAFFMRKGLTLTANFLPNPFRPALTGEYTGWVHPVAGVPEVVAENSNFGLIKIVVGATGAFSGRVLLEGESLPFVGVFSPDGLGRFGSQAEEVYRIVRPMKPSLVLRVTLSLEVLTEGRVSGVLQKEERSGVRPMSEFVAERARYDGKTEQTSTRVRSVNVAIPAPSAVSGYVLPTTGGMGTLSISRAGVGVAALTLPDGTKVSGSAPLGEGDIFVMYAPLYLNGRGGISGGIHASEGVVELEVAPVLKWFRPYLSFGQYPQGWPEGVDVHIIRIR